MKRFPNVSAVVTPLYKVPRDDFQESHGRPENRPLLPDDPKANFAESKRTVIRIVESRMYEPVSDGCRGPTNLTTNRSSSNFPCKNHEQPSDLDDELANGNFPDEQDVQAVKSAADCPPQKPPRRHKLHKAVRRNSSLERRRGSDHRMRMDTTDNCIDIDHISLETERNYRNKFVTVGVQTCHLIPYRLRLWPKLSSGSNSSKDSNRGLIKRKVLQIGRIASQWFLSQVGLTIVLLNWALLGAAAFYHTEGPRELAQSEQIDEIQKELSVELATTLRQVSELSQVWPQTIERSIDRHKTIILEAVSAGYGEGGGGRIWTYPGCILFSVSLLTTLGFGAPVPRTAMGRGAAVLFAAIGIPLHFLLILNIGNLLAGKLQQWKKGSEVPNSHLKLLRWFPVVIIVIYYVLGLIFFGILRERNAVDCFMFPLDFTAAGGVGRTAGHVRICYALYLELAVILAAIIVSLLQASATRGIVDFGLKLGLLTNS